MDELAAELTAVFGRDAVWSGEDLLSRNNGYLDNSPLKAKALLRPASTAEAAGMLRQCNTAGQTVVPHGGLTNLVYNTRTTENDMALSLERMEAVETVDAPGMTMTVQAGATLHKIQEAASAGGLFFPLDLAARDSATLGGLIANNAGGTRVLRYGMMRDLVLGLEVVLADGSVLSALNQMLKNNAGYDLKHLFIGSEGTLGVITRSVLRLWPLPGGAATALLGMERFPQVVELLALAQSQLSGTLSSFEVMWNEFYRLTTTPPALSKAPLRSDYALYVLVETLGPEHAAEQTRLADFLEKAHEHSLFSDAVVAGSSSQREALWRIREDSEQIEAQYQPTFSFDVSLPLAAMEGYVNGIRQELNRAYGEVKCWVFGHAADSNLHIGVWGSAIRQSDQIQVESIIYQPLLALKGSISAEHGIGLEKKAYLSLSRSAEEIALMRRLKAALDPRGILNPGKIFDLTG